MSDAVTSTIGEQRRTNYALRPMSEDAFVAAVTEGQSVAPLYFAFAADANRHDHELLDDQEPPRALTFDEARDADRAPGRCSLDTRSPEAFASGHLRGRDQRRVWTAASPSTPATCCVPNSRSSS